MYFTLYSLKVFLLDMPYYPVCTYTVMICLLFVIVCPDRNLLATGPFVFITNLLNEHFRKLSDKTI